MTDLNKDVNVELHDEDINDIVEENLGEAQEPKGGSAGGVKAQAVSEPESVASVDAAAKGTKQAPARKGDNKNSEKSNLPKSKAALINAMYNKMSGMKKEDLEVMASNFLGEDVVIVTEAVDSNEELQAIVEGEATLSEEFKEKTAIIFEAALRSKLSEEVVRLEEQYAEELAEEVSSIKEGLVNQVDSYLNYVVESWMEENKIAIQNGLRTEIAETFMLKMKDLFVESYIDVPESKVDLVDELADQVSELEEKLNTTTGDAIALAEELEMYKRNAIIAEAARDLADTQFEKLKDLAEGIDFESEEDFAKKVATIKESYFSKEIVEVEEVINEEAEEIEVSSVMENYLAAIRKSSKK